MRMLLSQELVKQQHYNKAALMHSTHGGTLGYYLVKMGAISSTALLHFLSAHFPMPYRPRDQISKLSQNITTIIILGLNDRDRTKRHIIN